MRVGDQGSVCVAVVSSSSVDCDCGPKTHTQHKDHILHLQGKNKGCTSMAFSFSAASWSNHRLIFTLQGWFSHLSSSPALILLFSYLLTNFWWVHIISLNLWVELPPMTTLYAQVMRALKNQWPFLVTWFICQNYQFNKSKGPLDFKCL